MSAQRATSDTQRKSAQAFIASEQHDSWIRLPSRYADGESTAAARISRPEVSSGAISAEGRGGAIDKVMVDRLWWSVKFEKVLQWICATAREADDSLLRCFEFFYQ